MGKIILGFKFRLYPNKEQANLINRTLGSCRFVYNHFLATRRDEWFVNHHSLNLKDTMHLLTYLKRRTETSWLYDVDNIALQQSLRDLDRAYQNFFKKRARYPSFKKKHANSQSYRTNNNKSIRKDGSIHYAIRIENSRINLPKIGFVKIKQSRLFEGRILNATISRIASGKYFVSPCVEMEKEKLQRTCGTREIGLDVGIKYFCTDHHGNVIENPRPLQKLSQKLKREQRRLARKFRGGVNREKNRIRVANIYERIANIRKDFLHKLSTQLIRENQTIAVEHLHIKGMLKNHKLARAISDVSWGEFFRQLEYKAKLSGARILKVDTFFPSSQTCSVCGFQNTKVKSLAIREWQCPECGTHHNRDKNAARNILHKALELASA